MHENYANVSDEAWQAIQAKLNGHFLQSVSWGHFQRALGMELARAAEDAWAYQGIVTRSRGLTYLYVPYGPALIEGAAMGGVTASWRRGEPVDFVRFEPMGTVSLEVLASLGARPVAEVQPAHTAVLSLEAEEAVLRSGLSSGHRNAVNGAGRRGLTFRASTDPADGARFLELIHQTAARTGFRPHSDRYYQTMLDTLIPEGAARLFMAEHEGAVVAAAIAFDGAGVRYYAHAAARPEARQLQAAAPLVWQMITDAKAQGLREFDLWGVAPEGAADGHPWAGFTAFKLAFGAQRRDYAGTWELPLRPFKHRLYRLAKTALKGRVR